MSLLREMSLFDIGGIQCALQDLLGVPLDVLAPKGLSLKFRVAVLAEAVPV